MNCVEVDNDSSSEHLYRHLMKRTTKRFTLLLGALALMLNTSSADQEKAKTASAKAAPAKADPAKEKKAEEAFDVEVKITGNDLMQFDKKAFTVESGKKVKLTFKNVGKLPKAAMGHNVVILKKGVNKVTFATAAITAGPAADYLPAANKKDILAHTKLLGPGEEESIFFTAPEPGNYDYLCTFPGHFAIMSGIMSVK